MKKIFKGLAFTALFLINSSQQQPCVPIGNTCLPESEIQRCHDHLEDLSSNADSVDNICNPDTKTLESPPSEFYVESRHHSTLPPNGTQQQIADSMESIFQNAPQPAGYCKKNDPNMPLGNQVMCGGGIGTNLIQKYYFKFYEAEGATYDFRYGIDHEASAFLIDGQVVFAAVERKWWSGVFANGYQFSVSLAVGVHEVVMYGFEDCCGGAFQLQFSRNGSSYLNMNSAQANSLLPTASETIQTYDIEISYVNGYVFDNSCVTQSVTFESNTLVEGTDEFNEWQFNPANQVISFTVKHSDLESYGCIKTVELDEYTWQCEMALHIYFAGVEQYVYSFLMKISLSRVYKNQLNVNVLKNQVVGDCCENTLNIVTDLNFCTDFSCAAYLPDGLVVQRKQSFFLEHKIVSPEFQYYYLHGLQVRIGPFVPDIIQTNGSQPGRIIYEVQSNVAANGMVIEAISRIAETAQRRFLQAVDKSKEIGDDYKVKGSNQITVQDPNQKNTQTKKSDNTTMIAIIASIGGVLLIGGSLGLTYFIYKRGKKSNLYKSNKKSKFERQSTEEIAIAV